jgi:hypothetical protein
MIPGPKRLDQLTDDEQKRVEEWETAPLDEVAASAIKKHADAFTYFRRGASIPHCLWASQHDHPRDGVGTRCPQVPNSYSIRYALLLRARYRFAHGQPQRAVDDLLALVCFARHLEVGSSLVGVLTSYGIERDAMRVLADNIWVLVDEPRLLVETRDAWDKLPAARPMTDGLKAERDGLVGMFRHGALVDTNNPPDDELGQPIGFIPTLRFILGQETYEQSVTSLCGTVEKHYTRLIEATAVPPDKIKDAEMAFFANWDKDVGNDDLIAVEVTKLLFPAAAKLRLAEAEMHTRRTMLRAALAIATDGRDRLKTHLDPFTKEPFDTRRVEGGYELSSTLANELGKPLVLIVRTARPPKE